MRKSELIRVGFAGLVVGLLLALAALATVAQEIDHTGDLKLGERLFQGTCSGCHGSKGASAISAIPRLSAQVPSFLLFQWSNFKSGARQDQPGHAKMQGIGDREIRAMASYVSAQPVGAPWPSRNPKLRAAGEKLYQSGDYSRKIIACAVCHGKDGAGVNSLTIPSVANQSPLYLVEITHVFQTPVDFHSAIGNGMQIAVMSLTDDDIRAVSDYMASMGARQDSTGK